MHTAAEGPSAGRGLRSQKSVHPLVLKVLATSVKLRVKNASFIGRAVLEDTTVLSPGLVHNDANWDYRAYYL
jgi:hypothetical protein